MTLDTPLHILNPSQNLRFKRNQELTAEKFSVGPSDRISEIPIMFHTKFTSVSEHKTNVMGDVSSTLQYPGSTKWITVNRWPHYTEAEVEGPPYLDACMERFTGAFSWACHKYQPLGFESSMYIFSPRHHRFQRI